MTDTPAMSISGKTVFTVVQFILPVILAMAAGYGAVKYSSGETQQKLMELQRRMTENRDDMNKVIDNQITRRKMQLYIDQTRSDLTDIKNDVRELRKR